MSAGYIVVKRKNLGKKNSPKPERLKKFEEFFAAAYGERWLSLRAALLTDPRQEVLRNPFSSALQDYRLDAASVLPARFLECQPQDRVADFCASPGGKSLAMIFALNGEAHFSCNDLSRSRVQRLKAVFHDCLPPAVINKIHITKSDASRWGLSRAGEFDRILIDAPCSGERHLLGSPQELGRWSLKAVKGLVVRQHSLLCSALDCLKPGGRLVYSTCSVNPMENDGVVHRLKESREGLFHTVPVAAEIGEPTELGWIVLPDRFDCGPIYFSVLEKTAAT